MRQTSSATAVAQTPALNCLEPKQLKETIFVLQFANQTLQEELAKDMYLETSLEACLLVAEKAFFSNRVLEAIILLTKKVKESNCTIEEMFAILFLDYNNSVILSVLQEAYKVTDAYYKIEQKEFQSSKFLDETFKSFVKENQKVFKELISYVQSIKPVYYA